MRTTLYPNPARDILWVSVRDPTDAKLRLTVFDALGTSRHTQEVQANETEHASIRLDSLPAGAYYLQMENGHEDCMKSFMIVR